jgi:putative FmdB family regulatory protein
MPIFEYRCANCNQVFEELRLSRSETRVECPHCGATRAEQLFSVFATRSGNGGGDCWNRAAGICEAGGGAMT